MHRLHGIVSAVAVLAIFSAGCGDNIGTTDDPDASARPDASPQPDAALDPDAGGEPDLLALYRAAVEDAEIAEASEISDTLVAITPENDALVRDDDGRVLMVTWTSFPGYDDLIGEDTTLAREVWVTPGRTLQDFCTSTGLQGDDLSLRLEQLLGLPPANGKDRVVELWVTPEAMFRPSPDSEITDSVAELDFPPDTPQAYIDWFNDLKASSYGDSGYPWTRLGYTYDWNPDTSEVGLSEFVITQGSTVGVNSVTATDAYCQASGT